MERYARTGFTHIFQGYMIGMKQMYEYFRTERRLDRNWRAPASRPDCFH